MEDKFLVIVLNCSHPTKEHAFFLLSDEDENTVIFDTEEAAKKWIEEADTVAPFAYSILCTGDFEYHLSVK